MLVRDEISAACAFPHLHVTVVVGRDGLETKSKDSSDCASVHKNFFGKRFKGLPKPRGPGGSMPVDMSKGYLEKA